MISIEGVLKGLEVCENPDTDDCHECPYYGKTRCIAKLHNDAYGLIMKLKMIESHGAILVNCDPADEIKKVGSYIITTPETPIQYVYKKICEDLIANGILLMDVTTFPDEITYSWCLKGVKSHARP